LDHLDKGDCFSFGIAELDPGRFNYFHLKENITNESNGINTSFNRRNIEK